MYLIETAEKGIAWMQLTAQGTAGHGSMVHPDNAVTALAAAVERLVSDLPRLDELKRNSFEATRTDFNWDVQSRPYRALLEELCSRHEPAG
jgi:acetylornithine deacetylase/succinyl-diaminopimelate desuccinylase-like protein